MGKKKQDNIAENEQNETMEQEVQNMPEERPEDEKSEQELLVEKFDELSDRYLRLMAEYDNFRKRTQKEKEDIYPAAMASAVSKFLPVLDNLERASSYDPGTEDFAKGFEMICQGFQDVLTSMGVEAVGEAGEPFDPAFHNAAMHIEDENLGINVVSQVFQKGYKIGDRVIRYAMVQTAN